MDHNLDIGFANEGESGFLRAHAVMKALPGDFILRSYASKAVQIDPQMTHDAIVGIIEKGYRRVYDRTRGLRGRDICLVNGGDLVSIEMARGFVHADVYSAGPKAQEIASEVLSGLGTYKFENKEEDGVWVDFSHATNHGIVRKTEFVRCPTWTEIAPNYPAQVSGGLRRLMEMKTPWEYGRLIIWHGEPGTGKTFALRALMMEWRERFDFLVVTDPEKLASNPSYYYEVASEPKARPMRYNPRVGELEEEEEEEEPTHKRLLFVFEDSADLVISESRSHHWDKIGKLLNITDGLLGQGREDVFIVTFNEKIDEIDPAFIRPGRCISKLEFGKFDTSEARQWLGKKGIHDLLGVSGELTLAELYARMLGIKSKELPQVGFAKN